MFVLEAFLLTREWRDTPSGLELVFWASCDQGPVRIRMTGQDAVCFIARDTPLSSPDEDGLQVRRQPLDLKTLDGESADGLYFRAQRDLVALRGRLSARGARLCESDLKPADRFLMERFITGSFAIRGDVHARDGYLEFINPALRRAEHPPTFKSVALDIETEGLDGALYSIAVASSGDAKVFMVGDEARPTDPGVLMQICPSERSVLEAFLDWVHVADPDLILGWNVVSFDLDFLERKAHRLGIPFALGRGGERAKVLRPQSSAQIHVARIPGRVVLDGIDTLRAAFWSFENFGLEHVAQALLGRGKLIQSERDKVAEIQRLFNQDKTQLAAYNIEDCRLVLEIFERADLINFAIQRAQMTGLSMDRAGGSVAAFDNLYLPRLHRRGFVAPDIGARTDATMSPGGYVMDSAPGLYDNVLVLDFKSLYPSIIRTFKIDPLGLADAGTEPIPGFEGAAFSREASVLPDLIAELLQLRERAKQQKNAALSQAIKILMNSFYGVLGAHGCRFFDPRLASSITRRGHEIITRSRDFIQRRGFQVIYGDTDSLFVLLGSDVDERAARAAGTELADALNSWWRETLEQEYRLESFLEIEFETHYIRFLMPTVRGADTGSKKRYAGYVRDARGDCELVFKGLESVRTDWTPLARRFQRELYRRVFFNEPFDAYVRDTLADLLAGKLDDELVYRKRVRRRLEDYTRNVPPHVQAARKQPRPGKWVTYVITRNGPEPVDNNPSPLDYEHYREKQLMPVADGILHFLGTGFDALTSQQMEIF